MLKKEISYEDLDGNTLRETFYFNLNKGELVRYQLEMTTPEVDGVEDYINGVLKRGIGREIIEVFEDLVKRSYGVRGTDGKSFIKNDQVWESFISTDAYSELLYELTTDAKAATAFFQGLVPRDFRVTEEDIQNKVAEINPQVAQAMGYEPQQPQAQNAPQIQPPYPITHQQGYPQQP